MALSRNFDPIFALNAGPVPINLLRAIAQKESGFNPSNATGPAWGLMQIVRSVRDTYNRRFGTRYTQRDLLNPAVNIKLGANLLGGIAAAYNKHPSRNMRIDWSNPEFVNLVMAGWNSGYSEAGGVGKVASYMERKGIPVTHDGVFRYAGAAGATRQLQNDAKRRWQKGVTSLYFQEGGEGSSGFLIKVGLSALAAWAIYRVL